MRHILFTHSQICYIYLASAIEILNVIQLQSFQIYGLLFHYIIMHKYPNKIKQKKKEIYIYNFNIYYRN